MVSVLKYFSALLVCSALASAQVLQIPNGGTGTTTPGDTGGTGISVSGAWPNENIALTGGQLTAPFLLKFGPPIVLPYYDPQPSGLIDASDTFTSTGNYTQQTGGGTVSFSVASNVGTVTSSGTFPAVANFLLTSDTTLVAPQFFNSIEVTAITPGTGFANIYAGAFKDNSNYVACYYDAVNHAIHTEYRFAGTNQNTTQLSSLTLTPPYWIGCSLVGNSLSAWYKTSLATNNWIFAGNIQTQTHFDYTTTANFASAGYKTGFQTSWDSAGSVSVANLQGGRFGGVIMRDLKPVVNQDWTTYQPGGNLIYFVASVGDPVGTQIGPNGGTTQGVFTLNVNSQAITEKGVICNSRSSHIYCGDAAGSIIYHSNGDRELLLSSWGDVTPPTNHAKVEYQYITSGSMPDILTTNLSVTSAAALTLPLATGATDAYDPALVFDSAHSRYLMAYTEGTITPFDFYPAMASASTPTGTWTLVGDDHLLQGNWEGTSFSNVNGTLYELTGGPRYWPIANWNTCNSSRIYDETFTFLGPIPGATFQTNDTTSPSAVNCSHPTLAQHPDGYHMILLTFDGELSIAANTGSSGRPMMELSTQ